MSNETNHRNTFIGRGLSKPLFYINPAEPTAPLGTLYKPIVPAASTNLDVCVRILYSTEPPKRFVGATLYGLSNLTEREESLCRLFLEERKGKPGLRSFIFKLRQQQDPLFLVGVHLRTDPEQPTKKWELDIWNYHPARREMQHVKTVKSEGVFYGYPLGAQIDVLANESFDALTRLYFQE